MRNNGESEIIIKMLSSYCAIMREAYNYEASHLNMASSQCRLMALLPRVMNQTSWQYNIKRSNISVNRGAW